MSSQKKNTGTAGQHPETAKSPYMQPKIILLSSLHTEGTKFMVSMSEGSIMIGMGTFSFGPS